MNTVEISKTTMAALNILVVDTEEAVRKILETRLTIRGYNVYTAKDGDAALDLFQRIPLNLVILEILLPTFDGYQLCSKLRKQSNIPIIMISSLADISDRILGLELGADDYIIKPFSPKELEARIRAVFRRTQADTKPQQQLLLTDKKFKVDNLIVDLDNHNITKNGKKIHLTSLEFKVLELLIRNAGELLSRAYILRMIWGYLPERYVDTRVVDVHIARIRSKIENNLNSPTLILTARGVGYKFRNF